LFHIYPYYDYDAREVQAENHDQEYYEQQESEDEHYARASFSYGYYIVILTFYT